MLTTLYFSRPTVQREIPDWWQTTFTEGRKTAVIQDASGVLTAIAYGEHGNGQPLFLLHGIGSWSYSWRHSIAPLAAHHRVICVDAKGHGYSPPTDQPERVGHQIIELARILETLSRDAISQEPQPAVVVAESLGALTALAVAQQYPHLVDRLVLINVPIFPRRLPSWGMRVLAYLPLSMVRWFDQARLVRPLSPVVRYVTRQLRREVVADPQTISEEDVFWLTYPYVRFPGTITRFATDLRLAACDIQQFHEGLPSQLHEIQARLAEVTHPTLVLWGDRDRWFPVEDGVQLCDRLPNARLQVLLNCGHNASGSCAEAVNAAILEFLKGAIAVPDRCQLDEWPPGSDPRTTNSGHP